VNLARFRQRFLAKYFLLLCLICAMLLQIFFVMLKKSREHHAEKRICLVARYAERQKDSPPGFLDGRIARRR